MAYKEKINSKVKKMIDSWDDVTKTYAKWEVDFIEKNKEMITAFVPKGKRGIFIVYLGDDDDLKFMFNEIKRKTTEIYREEKINKNSVPCMFTESEKISIDMLTPELSKMLKEYNPKREIIVLFKGISTEITMAYAIPRIDI